MSTLEPVHIDDWCDLAAPPSGLTILQVVNLYGRPLREVRQAFVWGSPPHLERIGRADEFHVWFADQADVERVFGAPKPLHLTAAVERRAAKLARLQAILDGGEQ